MRYLLKDQNQPTHPAPSRQSPASAPLSFCQLMSSQGPGCLPPTVSTTPLPTPVPSSPPAQAAGGLPPPAPSLAPLLTASWGWCPTPARREWRRATPRPPTRLSALCTHWYSEPPGAGPANGPTEPAAAGARGPRPGPARSRPPRPPPPPPPPPWLPPCAAARGRWARVKGHSERRPARPFAAAHPGSHCGDWRQGPCAGSFTGSVPAHRGLATPSPRPRPASAPPAAVPRHASARRTCRAGEFQRTRGLAPRGRMGAKPHSAPAEDKPVGVASWGKPEHLKDCFLGLMPRSLNSGPPGWCCQPGNGARPAFPGSLLPAARAKLIL